MLTVGIIQARMGSTRLPGKQVMDIAGRPLIWRVVKRAMQAKKLDGVVVAIPEESNSVDIIAALCDCKVPICIMPGNPSDLLDRYNHVAQMFKVDTIVRIPGDNPCIDPDEIDRIVEVYEGLSKPVGQWLTTNLDRNVLNNGYPGGLGAEVYDSWFMHWMHRNIDNPEFREHPHKWGMATGRVHTIKCPEHIRRPELHFDVNTIEDLEYIRGIYDAIGPDFRAKDIIEHLDNRRLN